MQGGVPDAAMVGSNHSSEQALASPTDRRTPDPMKQDRHRLDARGNLLEIFAKIASAMPCDPDQYVANAWRTMQASRTSIDHNSPCRRSYCCPRLASRRSTAVQRSLA